MTDTTVKPRKGLLARMPGVLIDPGATFDDIVARPDAAGPVLFIIITGALSVVSIISTLNTLPETTPTGVPMPPPALTAVSGILGLILGLLVWWPIRALIFMGVGSLLGAKSTFSQSLAVSGYLNVTQVLSALVSAIAFATTGRSVTLGLGMMLSAEQAATPLGVVLNAVNVFGLIYIALSTVALAKLWKVSTSKSAAATIVLWLIVVGLSVASAHLGRQFTEMLQVPQ
ncbi:MAG TPA: YIP1 family protein [Firmicutes bacterium]|nr:YIP1 family protein [Bacillota bacterium]